MIPRTAPIYQVIAGRTEAIKSCIKTGSKEWEDKHGEILDAIEKDLPRGSGIDSGTTIDRELTTRSKIVLKTAYHHMDTNGYYDGWTEHTVIVTPSFDGIDIRITGRNRNDIKDYLHEIFDHALSQQVNY
tara:strand:- start:2456 stop:2845 length:390 start_codon:yes stop_codon:yes gene_type:complete